VTGVGAAKGAATTAVGGVQTVGSAAGEAAKAAQPKANAQ